jgi:hypothetical protein
MIPAALVFSFSVGSSVAMAAPGSDGGSFIDAQLT